MKNLILIVGIVLGSVSSAHAFIFGSRELSEQEIADRQQMLLTRMGRETAIFDAAGLALPAQRFPTFNRDAKLTGDQIRGIEASYRGALEQAVDGLTLPRHLKFQFQNGGDTAKILDFLSVERNMAAQPKGQMDARLREINDRIATEERNAAFAAEKAKLNEKIVANERLILTGARTTPQVGNFGDLRALAFTDPNRPGSGPITPAQVASWTEQIDAFRARSIAAVNQVLPPNLHVTEEMFQNDPNTLKERLDLLDRHHEAVTTAMTERRFGTRAEAIQALKKDFGLEAPAAVVAAPVTTTVRCPAGTRCAAAPVVASPERCPGGACPGTAPVVVPDERAAATPVARDRIRYAQGLLGTRPDGIEGDRTGARVAAFVERWNSTYRQRHNGAELTLPEDRKLTPEIISAIQTSERDLIALRRRELNTPPSDPWERQYWERQRSNAEFRRWHDSPVRDPLDLGARVLATPIRAGMEIFDPERPVRRGNTYVYADGRRVTPADRRWIEQDRRNWDWYRQAPRDPIHFVGQAIATPFYMLDQTGRAVVGRPSRRYPDPHWQQRVWDRASGGY
ncbi:MAG: hypothetical protein HY078_04930 [Elusimicrobia bacterium]|nr:hypothetical protein [Elusimicrobiota bacterium]